MVLSSISPITHESSDDLSSIDLSSMLSKSSQRRKSPSLWRALNSNSCSYSSSPSLASKKLPPPSNFSELKLALTYPQSNRQALKDYKKSLLLSPAKKIGSAIHRELLTKQSKRFDNQHAADATRPETAPVATHPLTSTAKLERVTNQLKHASSCPAPLQGRSGASVTDELPPLNAGTCDLVLS